MKRDTRSGLTIKRIFGLFWMIIYMIIIALYVISSAVTMRQTTGTIEKSIKLSITSGENAVENSLEMIDMYLYENYYIDSPNSISNLCFTYLNSEDAVESSAALQDLSRIVSSIQSWTDNLSFDMLYITDPSGKKDTWLDAGDSASFPIRKAVKEIIRSHASGSDNTILKRYMVYDYSGQRQILRVMKFDRCYFAVGLSNKAMIDLLNNAKYSKDSICFAAEDDGNIIFSSAPIGEAIVAENDGRYIEVMGKKYLQTGYQSDKTGYYFGTLTDKASIQKELAGTRIIIAIALVITTLLLMLSRLYVIRYIERPITKGIQTMHEIEDGDFDTAMEHHTPIIEFNSLANSFNHMIERIKLLKIENYESELRTQKATMQYLQLQIKPHFYANLLNIIYSLAQSRDFDTIQRISKAIVNYSRYMFRDATELVELKRELEFLDCYMEIQEIRYRKQIQLEKDVEAGLFNTLVPPFIIQTFVENSVKYAFSTKKNCLIKVQAKQINDETIKITIHDNGMGYPEQVIANDFALLKENGHIGLANVNTRLQIIYDDKASLEFENDEGALTSITLPLIDLGI
ncbi:MAG: histidine kinase [Butyrivibrio sp.]|nr:histidine kinase [Butyrivibrio sp.]